MRPPSVTRPLTEIGAGRTARIGCEEILSERFAEVLKRLVLDGEILEWVKDALRQSHGDEKQFHEEAITRFQADYALFQNRLDAMYLDKLDGRVDQAYLGYRPYSCENML